MINTRDRNITVKLTKKSSDQIFDLTADVYLHIICDLNLLNPLPPPAERPPLFCSCPLQLAQTPNVRPFLYSRSPPVENGDSDQSKTALFDRSCFGLDSSGPSYRQSSPFYSFCAFPIIEAVGVKEYCCMSLENRLAALSAVLRAFFASNACFARDEPSSKAGWCRWA